MSLACASVNLLKLHLSLMLLTNFERIDNKDDLLQNITKFQKLVRKLIYQTINTPASSYVCTSVKSVCIVHVSHILRLHCSY